MFKKRTLQQLIDELKNDEQFMKNVQYWHVIEEKEGRTVPFPGTIDDKIVQALKKRGIPSLYTHQAEAFSNAFAKKSYVAVTPTASGKTLCYNLPVLQQIIEDENSRALYIFPTKALAQDQKSELNEIIDEMGVAVKCFTYDGDTAPNIRQSVRKAGHVVITNPDMLHSAILPHHTKWVGFFENLKYVVIDELHTYRGVFGSHVANVIRRLKRIAQYYGSNPVFMCTSATIANPQELAGQLTGEEVVLINNNGAPQGKKHFIFYNPPVVNEPLQIRKSTTKESIHLATTFLKENIQTIVFAKSRVRVEIIYSHLQQALQKSHKTKIRAYRGGYLPNERRQIEKGLRSGEISGVVSTNALELGVDIGQLQVCIMTGYPGSIASSWQQAGRAGRRKDESLTILVANSSPLDQFMMNHPQYFFERSPESARLNPNNLIILVDHLKCAAFELPFKKGETFGGEEVTEILQYLTEERILHESGNKWYWMNDAFPAHGISLRSASQENVVIIDQSDLTNVKVIGEMDRFSAMTLLHDEAIYLHQGRQYQVEKLDWDEKKAFVTEVEVEYFTDANLAVQMQVLEIDENKPFQKANLGFGDVMINAKATIFKKIKLSTFENIGSGPIHLPEEELHTNAMWMSFENDVIRKFSNEESLEHALNGLAKLFQQIAPIFVMCDANDLHVVPQIKAIHNEKPTIFLYDRYPGGIGLSKEVFTHFSTIFLQVVEAITRCRCEDGCPSCIGATVGKSEVMKLVRYLMEEDYVN